MTATIQPADGHQAVCLECGRIGRVWQSTIRAVEAHAVADADRHNRARHPTQAD